MLKKLLTCPRARGLDIDDPRTTEIRRRIILEKPFLRRLYDEWFKGIRDELPAGKGPVVEVGSGAGYLEEFEDRRKDKIESRLESPLFNLQIPDAERAVPGRAIFCARPASPDQLFNLAR